MKRMMLVWVMILITVFLSSCAGVNSNLVGSWIVDTPDEYDLSLGKNPRYGDIAQVVYRISRYGDLAIVYTYSSSEETDCFDIGPVTIDKNRIKLGGEGTYTIDGNTLTIYYDDGTVRTFTRVQQHNVSTL